MSRNEQVNLAE